MKSIGWLLILLLAECFFLFAWLWPVPQPGDIIMATTLTGRWMNVPIERHMHVFSLYIAFPVSVIAAYLIDHEDA